LRHAQQHHVSDITVGKETIEPIYDRIIGRRAAEDIRDPEKTREKLIRRDEEIDEEKAKSILAAGVKTVKIRSVLACQAKYGVCAMCYGRNLATGLKSTSARRSASLRRSRSVNRARSSRCAPSTPARRPRRHHHRSAARRGDLRSAQAKAKRR